MIYNALISRTILNEEHIALEFLLEQDKENPDKERGGLIHLDLNKDNILKILNIFGGDWENINGKYCRIETNKCGKPIKLGHIIANNWVEI